MAESKQEWPKITPEERIQHETLFYSQGPLDGYLTGEKGRDVFLKSGLPLQVLSQIWNLADVSNDNLLNVHEFVLAMHLTLGVIDGLKPPVPLPRYLTPPKSEMLNAPLEESEKEAYKKIFKLLDKSNSGFIEADMAHDVFSLSGLPAEQLAQIWDIADLNRDGSLDPEEWMVACHLIRTVKRGQALDCPVNVYSYLPDRIAPNSLQARKRRVEEYEQKKQRFMALKEKRKQDVNRESRRLEQAEQKLKLCRELYNVLRNSGTSKITPEEFKSKVNAENAEITKQEEIVYRLKKEHEKVRQNTVKIILEEQKLNEDIRFLKRGTDELNKKLRAIHTKATKDPDPFHQLYEQKKEKKVTLADLDAGEIYIPFTFDPFDKKESSQKVTSGDRVFQQCDTKNNNHKLSSDIPEKVVISFKNIDDSFTDVWTTSSSPKMSSAEEDTLFKPVKPSSFEDDPWFSLHLSGDSLLGNDSKNFADLQRKLVDLKNEIQKLNMDGDRLVFKNPEEYTARKRAKEEEERSEKQRHQRRGVNGKENVKRHTYTSKPDEATQAAREYRIKRRSLNLDGGKPDSSRESPTTARRPVQSASSPSRSSRSKRLSTDSRSSVEDQIIEDTTTSPRPVVEKLDLTSLENSPEGHKNNQEGHIESLKSQERALKENNFQETKAQPPLEKTPRAKSPESSRNSGPESPVKSPPRSSVKKTRAPPPPGTTSPGPTSPKSPSSSSESSYNFSESPAKISVEASVQNSVEHAAKPSLEPPVKTSTDSPVKTSSAKPVPDALTKPAPISEETAPVAPPRLKKKKVSKCSSTSEQNSSSPASSPRKSDQTSVGKEGSTKNSKISRNSEILTEGSTSFNSSLEDSPNRISASKRPNGPGLTSDLSFEESKEKPVILSDSLESEIFGALKGSQLFKDTDSFHSDSTSVKTVTTSSVSRQGDTRIKSPVRNKATVVTQVESVSKSQSDSQPVKTETVSKNTPNSELFDLDIKVSSAHGGARPKIREPVKQETLGKESLRQEIVKEKTVVERREEPEEEEIETIIEEVIEIKTTLDASGNPILDSTAPGFRSQVISSKKTVLSQAVEPKVIIQENRLEETKPRDTTPPKPKQKLQETQSQGIKEDNTKQKSPKRKAPAPPVLEANKTSKVRSPTSKIEASPSSTPPSVRVKDTTKRSSIPDHLNGGAAPGYESDASDASSVPPPLPDSAPPPLPTNGPPLVSEQISHEEIVELEFKTPSIASSKSSSTGNMDTLIDLEPQDTLVSNNDTTGDGNHGNQGKSVAQMRADFFGLSKPSLLDIDDNEPSNSALEAYFSEMQRLDSGGRPDSDGSEEESGFNATFSPGDSGILISSLPTSPDETDSGSIQLISYHDKKQSRGGNSDDSLVRSSIDSAYDDTTVYSSLDFNAKGGNQTQTYAYRSESGVTSPRSEDGVTSPRGKVYDATEIVDKARQFAEKVQKPNFVVKRETSTQDDFDQERLQELELERRAVISQATVRKKFGPGLSSPTEENIPQFYDESTDSTEEPKQHWVLEDNENHTPDISWTGRPNKINLYSENVVQEGNTTDEVNRESISDLLSTRQQWETILSPVADKPETNKKQTSSTVRHWEVSFPNKNKSGKVDVERLDSDNSFTQMADTDTPTNESAIEREIRMNMEREANLRREQEERKEMMERQQGKVDTTMYESVPKDEPKPTFHELTEADRGSELWKRETIIQQELREQEEKEKALRKNQSGDNKRHREAQSNGQAEEMTESIIEREIRIQKEREAELHQQRQGKSVTFQQPEISPVPEPEPQASRRNTAEPHNDINHNQTKNISYEAAISNFQHEGESRIARELREAREREEELQHQRERVSHVHIAATPSTPQQQQQQSQPTSASKTTPRVTNQSPASRQGTWQRDVSPFLQKSKRSGSVDSLASSHSTGKSPSDIGTPNQDDDDFKEYKPKSETPIEREIRLARERENELRRSKGLPEIPDPKVERSGPPTTPVSSNDTPRYMRSYMDTSNTMKRYSSSRLQQEIIKQKQRELDLRKEGKIITTSEEHIEPLKYVAVTGQETTNANVKKNFVTRRSSGAFPPPSTDEVDGSGTLETNNTKTTPKADILKSRKVMSSGGAGFSYKESRNTAESKIERELREMREREDELRKQRMTVGADSSREETPNGKI